MMIGGDLDDDDDYDNVYDAHRNCVRRENVWSWVDVKVQILPRSKRVGGSPHLKSR